MSGEGRPAERDTSPPEDNAKDKQQYEETLNKIDSKYQPSIHPPSTQTIIGLTLSEPLSRDYLVSPMWDGWPEQFE